MKKMLRNLLLCLMVVLPVNAFALTYSVGSATQGDLLNVGYINIMVHNVDGTSLTTDEMDCSVTGADTSCVIEPNDEFEIYKNGDWSIIKSSSAFQEGAVIARLVVTNKAYSSTKVDATLKYKSGGEVVAKTVSNINLDGATAPLSDDATLKSLSVSVGEIAPKFEPGVDQYTVFGISDTNRRIKFTWECDHCNVEVSGGASSKNNEVELNNGENAVKLLVRSQAGNDTKTYNFTVIRGATAYNSNKLKELSIGDYALSPEFNGGIFEYEVKVPKKISNIENILKYSAEDTGATVKVEGANKLDKDESEVKITVTGRDGTKSEYKIKVVKEDIEEIIEVIGYKDNKVTYMNVEGTREELSVEEFKNKYPSEWEKIENNTYKFDENGNIIKNENTTNNEEPKKEDKKASFPWLIVVLIILAIIIIAVSGFFIFKDSDKDDDKKDGKKEEVEEVVEATPEEQEHLEDIDSYNEEARLIAEENLAKEAEAAAPIVEETKEEVVKEEVIDEFVSEEKTPTMDIDEALSDLMNTKEYNFKD